MSSVKVVLDGQLNRTFRSGETVTGTVECFISKTKVINGVRIRFEGRAETEWYKTVTYYDNMSNRTRTRNVKHSGEEKYFNEVTTLVHGGDNFRLPPGKHVYPFSYVLPLHLPSSFEGRYGNIRYYLVALIDCPRKAPREDRLGINYFAPVDLNYLPDVGKPVNLSVDKTMRSFFCTNYGRLSVKVTLPTSGFVPDQELSVGMLIDNMSRVNVLRVKFNLVGNLQFITHSPCLATKAEETILCRRKEGAVGAHGQKAWTTTMRIPADNPYPNLTACSIINMTYSLKIKISLSSYHDNIYINIPICIGNIPLVDTTTTFSGDPPLQAPLALLSAPSSSEDILNEMHQAVILPYSLRDQHSLMPEPTCSRQDPDVFTPDKAPPSYEESQQMYKLTHK